MSAYRDYLSTVYETSKALAEEGLETYEMNLDSSVDRFEKLLRH